MALLVFRLGVLLINLLRCEMSIKRIPCCQGIICKIWNHWLNPIGNWNEPLPTPEKRAIQAQASKLPNWLWWLLRNPFMNFNNHWLGIIPIGPRCTWRRPEETGWERVQTNMFAYWKKGIIRLPYLRIDGPWTFYIGWQERGSFGIALRRNESWKR